MTRHALRMAAAALPLLLPTGGALAQAPATPDAFCRTLELPLQAECLSSGELLMRERPDDEPALTLHLRASVDGVQLRYVQYGVDDAGATEAECPGTAATFALPVAQRVRLLVTSLDSVYALEIPSRAVAVDLVPGRVNEITVETPTAAAQLEARLRDELANGTTSELTLRIVEVGDTNLSEALCEASRG